MTDQDLDLLGLGRDHPDDGSGDDSGDGTRHERARPRRRRLRRVLIVLASLLALVLVAVGGFVGYLGWRVNDNVTQEDLLPTAPPPTQAADGSPIPETGVGTNFLLVGSDSRGDRPRPVRRHPPRAHPRGPDGRSR